MHVLLSKINELTKYIKLRLYIFSFSASFDGIYLKKVKYAYQELMATSSRHSLKCNKHWSFLDEFKFSFLLQLRSK
jgi:hypothetical protein